MRLTCSFAVILSAATALVSQEVAVPGFHTEKVQASYVLAVPPMHDTKKATPLILDFHGACPPLSKGANLTNKRVWSKFVTKENVLVLGLNSRTRSWNTTKGAKDDPAYALHVLDAVRKKHALKTDEVYLAGFSSGSDFLCKAGFQLRGKFAGSLVVCPGPASVLGIRKGEILRVKDHPFYFVTGEKDYIRKDGAWQAFLMLEKTRGHVMYREVLNVGHSFPSTAEYQRCFHYLRVLAGKIKKPDDRKIADTAFVRADYLLASTHALKLGRKGRDLLDRIEERGKAMRRKAERVSWKRAPGRAYEMWWRVMTQFHRFPELTNAAKRELAEDRGISNADMLRARGRYYRRGGRIPVPVTPTWRPPQDKKKVKSTTTAEVLIKQASKKK